MNREMVCQYISFDVFDTLIKRSVAAPSDVFRLMELYYVNEKQGKFNGFAEKRIQAEQRCLSKFRRPVSLTEIYDELREEYGQQTDELMRLEIQMEISGCQPIEENVAWYQRCINTGKHILLISDMYLSSDIITTMLDKCGIHGYFRLYISCEMKARKSDGTLFRKIIRELNIRPSEMFHIGDNWRSDFAVPAAIGIRVRHISKRLRKRCMIPKYLRPEAALSYRTLTACIENCSADMGEYEKQGARIFGPLLVGFTCWLAHQLRLDGITDVYFMARDGYTMKQAFDLMEPVGFHTEYLYCSRRSFVTPMLWKHSSLEDVFIARGLDSSSQFTIRRLLQVVGLSPDEYREQAQKYGLDIDHLYEKGTFFFDEQVRAFYEDIRRDVEVNSREEYEALLTYLNSVDMHGEIAVVDIGYYGTMQRALVELIAEEGLNIKVKGYYVGVCPTAPLVLENRICASGYLYDIGKNEKYFTQFAPFNGIFETLFLGPHGSVRRFVLRDGQGIPEFDKYEYEDKTGQKVDEVTVVREYQSGALNLASYVHEVMPKGVLQIEPDAAIYRLARLGMQPKLKEAKLWGNFRFHCDDVSYIARPHSWKKYIVHPGLLKKDFLPAIWKIGFMKRLFLLPLPYEKIIRVTRSIYRKK